MQYIYHVPGDYLTLEELLKKHRKTGVCTLPHVRDELRGQPEIEGFHGPCWGSTVGKMRSYGASIPAQFTDDTAIMHYEVPSRYDS